MTAFDVLFSLNGIAFTGKPEASAFPASCAVAFGMP
jgi:hypothetical protein